jgi:hypothetical protein
MCRYEPPAGFSLMLKECSGIFANHMKLDLAYLASAHRVLGLDNIGRRN